MKYTAFFAASTLAAVSAQANNARNLATLAEKWNLTQPEFAYDSNTFSLTFPVTDFINTGMVKYTLWTAPDCQEGGVSLDGSDVWQSVVLTESAALEAANTFGSGGTQLDSGAFNGRTATVNAAFDPQTVSSNTDIYSEQVIDNQVTAEIRFCIRVSLWTTSATVTTPVEVNFLETLVTLTVDLTDGFQIGAIDVEAKDRLVRTANQAYEVRGYECSADSTDAISQAEKDRPRNQGEIIHICVTPEDEAKTDGIFMRTIDDFTFTKGATVNQLAIEGNREAGNLLTSYSYTECEGSEVCRFSTILFAQFYANPGQVTGQGVASMQFGDNKTGATRRQLRAGDEGRALQTDGAGAAEFDLNFQVAQGAAQTESSGAGSTTMSAAAMSLAGVAAMAAMF